MDDEITQAFWIPLDPAIGQAIGMDPFLDMNASFLRSLRTGLKARGCTSAVRRKKDGVEITLTGPVGIILDIAPFLSKFAEAMDVLGKVARSKIDDVAQGINNEQRQLRRNAVLKLLVAAFRSEIS